MTSYRIQNQAYETIKLESMRKGENNSHLFHSEVAINDEFPINAAIWLPATVELLLIVNNVCFGSAKYVFSAVGPIDFHFSVFCQIIQVSNATNDVEIGTVESFIVDLAEHD